MQSRFKEYIIEAKLEEDEEKEETICNKKKTFEQKVENKIRL